MPKEVIGPTGLKLFYLFGETSSGTCASSGAAVPSYSIQVHLPLLSPFNRLTTAILDLGGSGVNIGKTRISIIVKLNFLIRLANSCGRLVHHPDSEPKYIHLQCRHRQEPFYYNRVG